MQPLFIESDAGKLFAIYWPPAGNSSPDKAIIHIPAFAEEMNKSRRMVALQARAFAEQGYAVLVLDLFGTGDSTGDFGEATWRIWLQDISAAIKWLKHQGAQSIALWGLRAGALLAMDFVAHTGDAIDRLICWQPVLNGEAFITQFLRLRVAAAMMNNNTPQEKTSDLKKQLLEGRPLEVAGYQLNPDLVKPLLALRADQLHLQNREEVAIFEVVLNEAAPVAVGHAQFLAKLHQDGINASLTRVVGDPFWTSQEISEAPELIRHTCDKVKTWF